MAIISQLELPGSPTEQASGGAATYYWDPTAELASGETLSSPAVVVLEYDPRYPTDTKDVTATVAGAGALAGDPGLEPALRNLAPELVGWAG